MTADEKLAAILAAVQTDPGNRGLARDPHDNLFTATAGDFQAACRSLARHPEPCVEIVTGFYIPTGEPPAGETDGPLGTAFLVRALEPLGFQFRITTDVSSRGGIKLGVDQVQIATLPPPGHAYFAYLAVDWRHAIQGYPPGTQRRMSHLIAIERAGPSRADGRPYSMRGRDLSAETPPAHHLFEEVVRAFPDVSTIGIGDGGNEIGMGKVAWATIARNIPNGERIACRVATDHLIVAGVSNWGAYALAAGVFVLRGVTPPADLFDPDRERQILEVMVREGPLVDGVTGQQTATVDGLTWDEYAAPLVRIRDILES